MTTLMTPLDGIRVPVARLAHVIAVKVLARDDVRRPQDGVDLVRLIEAASRRRLGVARRAVERIATRGVRSRPVASPPVVVLVKGKFWRERATNAPHEALRVLDRAIVLWREDVGSQEMLLLGNAPRP